MAANAMFKFLPFWQHFFSKKFGFDDGMIRFIANASLHEEKKLSNSAVGFC